MTRKMDMEYFLGLQVMFIKEITLLIKEMVMDKCIGRMEASLKVTGVREFNMVWEKFMFQMKDGRREFSKIMCWFL